MESKGDGVSSKTNQNRVKHLEKNCSKATRLSVCERQICKAIYALESIESISNRFSLTIDEARICIKRVCRKTGYKSPREFVKDIICCNITFV